MLKRKLWEAKKGAYLVHIYLICLSLSLSIVPTSADFGLYDSRAFLLLCLALSMAEAMPLSAALNTTRSGQILPGNSVSYWIRHLNTLCPFGINKGD